MEGPYLYLGHDINSHLKSDRQIWNEWLWGLSRETVEAVGWLEAETASLSTLMHSIDASNDRDITIKQAIEHRIETLQKACRATTDRLQMAELQTIGQWPRRLKEPSSSTVRISRPKGPFKPHSSGALQDLYCTEKRVMKAERVRDVLIRLGALRDLRPMLKRMRYVFTSLAASPIVFNMLYSQLCEKSKETSIGRTGRAGDLLRPYILEETSFRTTSFGFVVLCALGMLAAWYASSILRCQESVAKRHNRSLEDLANGQNDDSNYWISPDHPPLTTGDIPTSVREGEARALLWQICAVLGLIYWHFCALQAVSNWCWLIWTHTTVAPAVYRTDPAKAYSSEDYSVPQLIRPGSYSVDLRLYTFSDGPGLVIMTDDPILAFLAVIGLLSLIPLVLGWKPAISPMNLFWARGKASQEGTTKAFSVEWTCNCGHRGRDTLIDTEASVADDLIGRMWASGKCRTVFGNQASTGSSKGLLAAMQLSFLNLLNAISRGFKKRRTSSTRSGIIAALQDDPTTSSRLPSSADYLLTCFKHSRYSTAYHTVPISEVRSDGQLFEMLRILYLERRSRLTKWRSLHQLRATQFVQFALRKDALVDCIEPNKFPPDGATHYGYRPRPVSGGLPPIGENFMMHLFTVPHYGDGDTLCLDQMPKRLEQKPQRGQDPDHHTGWGIHFVEGVHVAKLYTILVMVVAFGSLLFGVMYWRFTGDIQGAFTVAAYMTSLLTLVVGTWQVWAVTS